MVAILSGVIMHQWFMFTSSCNHKEIGMSIQPQLYQLYQWDRVISDLIV